MDILKPDWMKIDGITYRINPGNFGNFNQKEEDNEMPLESLSDDEEDIIQSPGGLFTCNFHVPKVYFAYLIGSKGATKKRLETETSSKIIFPKMGRDGNIVVNSPSKNGVASARRRIRMMVLSARKRLRFTHFVSIPINQPSFMDGFMRFKEGVLQKCGNDRGIDEELFQNPHKLHITIGMLTLCDEIEREEASSALQECKEAVIKPLLKDNKLRISMAGVDTFSEDPEEVKVLYSKVSFYEDSSLLQNIADGIDDFFSKQGLFPKSDGTVKLHATIMNTHFKDENENITFNARHIFEHFHDFYFGDGTVETIELSLLHSINSEDSYYKATSTITIP